VARAPKTRTPRQQAECPAITRIELRVTNSSGLSSEAHVTITVQPWTPPGNCGASGESSVRGASSGSSYREVTKPFKSRGDSVARTVLKGESNSPNRKTVCHALSQHSLPRLVRDHPRFGAFACSAGGLPNMTIRTAAASRSADLVRRRPTRAAPELNNEPSIVKTSKSRSSTASARSADGHRSEVRDRRRRQPLAQASTRSTTRRRTRSAASSKSSQATRRSARTRARWRRSPDQEHLTRSARDLTSFSSATSA